MHGEEWLWSIPPLKFIFSGNPTNGGCRRAPVDPQLNSWVPEVQLEISLDTSTKKYCSPQSTYPALISAPGAFFGHFCRCLSDLISWSVLLLIQQGLPVGKGSDWKRRWIHFAVPALTDDVSQPSNDNTRTLISIADSFWFDFLLPLHNLVHQAYLTYQTSN